jgi:hypothetical protein
MGEAEKSRLLAESKEVGRGERTGQQPGWFSICLRSLRRTIGAALIGAGRRVQGTAIANLPEGTAR